MDFLTTQLIRLAAEACAAGKSPAVLDWWCELGGLVHRLAMYSRAFVFEMHGDWIALVPPKARCSYLGRVLYIAKQRSRPAPAALDQFTRNWLLEYYEMKNPESDPVVDANRWLAFSALCATDLSSRAAALVTEELLGSVQAIAEEFEASAATWPRHELFPANDDMTKAAHWLALPGPSRPRAGLEVDSAVEDCLRLALERWLERDDVLS